MTDLFSLVLLTAGFTNWEGMMGRDEFCIILMKRYRNGPCVLTNMLGTGLGFPISLKAAWDTWNMSGLCSGLGFNIYPILINVDFNRN